MVILDVFKKDFSDFEKPLTALALEFPCNLSGTGDTFGEGKFHLFLLALPSNMTLQGKT